MGHWFGQHYVSTASGRDRAVRIDWGGRITDEQRAGLERNFPEIRDAALFTENHPWHSGEQLNGPLFEQDGSGFVMARILQDKLETLCPGRSRRDIRDLWTRRGFTGRGARCIRSMLRAMLEEFVAPDPAKRSRPFPRGHARAAKMFDRKDIDEILKANFYPHLNHFTESPKSKRVHGPLLY